MGGPKEAIERVSLASYSAGMVKILVGDLNSALYSLEGFWAAL